MSPEGSGLRTLFVGRGPTRLKPSPYNLNRNHEHGTFGVIGHLQVDGVTRRQSRCEKYLLGQHDLTVCGNLVGTVRKMHTKNLQHVVDFVCDSHLALERSFV